MRLTSILFLFTCLFVTNAIAQNSEPKLLINLLANDKIADVNIDQDKFINSLKQVTEYCGRTFVNLSEKQKIGILVVAHKTGKTTYKVYSEPAIDQTFHDKILKDLSEIQVENTKLVDFPIFISVNSSTEGVLDFKNFEDPLKKQYTRYEAADLKTKIDLIKEYSIQEVLPILSAYQISVDDKFEGVKNFGKLVVATNFTQVRDCYTLTSKNKNYWRATMEMEIGNQLIPVTKVFMLASQGELDHAKKYVEILLMFAAPDSYATHYLNELDYRLELFYQQLDEQIGKGIAEHDKGNYATAIKLYEDILKIYPASSWTLYEKYYSESMVKQSNDNGRAAWDKAKIEIYKHNPLYNMDVRAQTGKEAYLIFRRQEISTLFKKKDDKYKDVFTYAEIATDLGVYDFAAQLFWLTATFDKDNRQKSIDNYLYCLDKLGETELKSNFKGDFTEVFKTIEKNKEDEMKSSNIYKSMKN